MSHVLVSVCEHHRGSVALWFAEHYPQATVRGVSNSNSQREWIMARAAERGITNLKIYTGNIVREPSPAPRTAQPSPAEQRTTQRSLATQNNSPLLQHRHA